MASGTGFRWIVKEVCTPVCRTFWLFGFCIALGCVAFEGRKVIDVLFPTSFRHTLSTLQRVSLPSCSRGSWRRWLLLTQTSSKHENLELITWVGYDLAMNLALSLGFIPGFCVVFCAELLV